MKKRCLGLLFLCALLVAGALWWISPQPSKFPGPFVLADGNRVHLVAVTVGTNRAINFGNPVERVLARLPGKAGKYFKRNGVTSSTGGGEGTNIVFWFSYDRPPENDTWLRAVFVENGEDINTPTFSSPPRTLPNGKTIGHCGTRLWPRRSSTLTVRLTQSRRADQQRQELGEITISNPEKRIYPLWTPESLPATQRLASVSFALEKPGLREIRMRVAFNGKTERAWEVWNYEIRDATGNFLPNEGALHRAPVRAVPNEFGIITMPLMTFGMPRENAWRLGVQLVRAQGLQSNEIFVLRGVPVTATNRRPQSEWTTNLPPGVVRFRHQADWVEGAAKLALTVSDERSFDFANPAKNPPAVLLLEAVNDLGERIEPVDRRKLHIPSGSTTLDVTIAIPPQHFVEYTVDPKEWLEPITTPAYLRMPDSIRPEKILREIEKR